MLPHLERDIIENRQVGEKRTELEQHAHASAHLVEAVAVEFVHDLARHPDLTLARFQRASDQTQQRSLAGTTDTHDRDHLAARDAHIDPAQDRAALVIPEVQAAYFNEVVRMRHDVRDQNRRAL